MQNSVKIGEVHQISSMGKLVWVRGKNMDGEMKSVWKFRKCIFLRCDSRPWTYRLTLSVICELICLDPVKIQQSLSHFLGSRLYVNKNKKKKMHFRWWLLWRCFIDFFPFSTLSGKFPSSRSSWARPQGIPNSGLRKRRAPLHAVASTRVQQHRSAPAAVVDSLSMSPPRQIGSLLNHGNQTEPFVGWSI